MEILIYFLKTKQIKSKSKNTVYYLVNYLIADGLEYKEQFISKELFEKLQDYEPLLDYTAIFQLDNNLKAKLVDIK